MTDQKTDALQKIDEGQVKIEMLTPDIIQQQFQNALDLTSATSLTDAEYHRVAAALIELAELTSTLFDVMRGERDAALKGLIELEEGLKRPWASNDERIRDAYEKIHEEGFTEGQEAALECGGYLDDMVDQAEHTYYETLAEAINLLLEQNHKYPSAGHDFIRALEDYDPDVIRQILPDLVKKLDLGNADDD